MTRLSFQQSRVPIPAPVPFLESQKWHPWGLLYTVPPALQGVHGARGSPYPLTELHIVQFAIAGEHGPKKGPCYPRLQAHAGPHTRLVPARGLSMPLIVRVATGAIPMAPSAPLGMPAPGHAIIVSP